MSAARWLPHRRRRFTRDDLDSPNWPHPRPARDPRLIWGYLCIVIPSIIQSLRGPAPTSMQGRNEFDQAATLAFAVMACVGSGLIIYAAFCESQYWSFVTELTGCVAIVVTYSIFLYGIQLVPDYWATNSAWSAAGLVIGHAIRAVVIGRRFW